MPILIMQLIEQMVVLEAGETGTAGSKYSQQYSTIVGGGATQTAGGTGGTSNVANSGNSGNYGIGGNTGNKGTNTTYTSNGAGGRRLVWWWRSRKL